MGKYSLPSYCFMLWLHLENYIHDFEGFKSFLLMVTGKSILEVKS